MKSFLFFLVFTCFASGLFASDAASTGMSFLKRGTGPSVSMGDMGVVLDRDSYSAFYNPALVGSTDKNSAGFSHCSGIQSLSTEALCANVFFIGFPIGVAVNSTSVNDIEIRTLPGESQGNFNATFFSLALSTGFSAGDKLRAGVGCKYLYQSIFSNDASGVALDFGLAYDDLVKNLNLALSVRNLGKMDNLKSEETKLPADIRLAASYELPLNFNQFKFRLAQGIQKFEDSGPVHLQEGAEMLFRDLLALRCGYISGYDSKSFSFGLGLKLSGFSLDYTYLPYRYSLGEDQLFSMSVML